MKSEPKKFYANPDFDEIFVFHEVEVPTSKKQFRPISEDKLKELKDIFPELPNELFYKDNKESAKKFIDDVKTRLLNKKKNRWPYKEKLTLTVGVSGSKSSYALRDLDNILKSVFDAFKGIVFEDDNQITLVIASKQIWTLNTMGFTVGLRVVNSEHGIDSKYHPVLWSENLSKEWSEMNTIKYSIPPQEQYNTFEFY